MGPKQKFAIKHKPNIANLFDPFNFYVLHLDFGGWFQTIRVAMWKHNYLGFSSIDPYLPVWEILGVRVKTALEFEHQCSHDPSCIGDGEIIGKKRQGSSIWERRNVRSEQVEQQGTNNASCTPASNFRRTTIKIIGNYFHQAHREVVLADFVNKTIMSYIVKSFFDIL